LSIFGHFCDAKQSLENTVIACVQRKKNFRKTPENYFYHSHYHKTRFAPMGTLSKMRTISPYVLVTIAVLFIAFMVISDMDIPGLMSRGQNPATSAIGTVNGEKIMYADFEKRVRDQAEQMRQQNPNQEDLDEAPVRERVWNEMTDEILMRQEGKRLGVTVSNEEILDILLQEPPDFLRQQFTDSTGRFNRETYLSLVTNPEIIAQRISPQAAADFKKMLVNLEDYIRREKLQSNMQAAIGSALGVVDPLYLERRYKIDNASADVDYVSFVPDPQDKQAQVKVGDEEVAAYYNEHQAVFKQKPSRKLKYVLMPLVPSQADSQKVMKRLQRLVTELNAAQGGGARDTVFERLASEFGGQTSEYKHTQDIAPEQMALVAPLQVREVAGPIQRPQGGFAFVRLDGKRSGENVQVKASHILLALKPGMNKDSLKAAAMSILAETKAAGADFAALAKKYSQDPGSAQRGGELGFFGKKMMVPAFEEAAFGADPGSVVGPVETQFGFHIIKVAEKKSDEMKFTEIVLNPTISTSTRNALFRQAQMLKEQSTSGTPFDSVAKRMKLEPQESGFFRRAVAAFGSRSLTDFAFESDLGAVSNPVEIKGNGLVVAQLVESRIAGIKPLADVKSEIADKLLLGKRLDALKSKAQAAFQKLAGLDSLSKVKTMDSSLRLVSMPQMRDNGIVTSVGIDPMFTAAMFAAQTQLGKIVGPIRGERGYYIAQVKSRKDADMAGLAAARPTLLQTERSKNLGASFQRWKNDLRDRADIEDNRGKFFRD
jgi:peptidyl-prolyl cis-trans isomerase D